MNKTNIKTTLPSCLGKKNLVYVETSNVLQLNTSPSVKRGKDEIIFFLKKKNKINSHPTETRITTLKIMQADVTDRKEKKAAHNGETHINKIYIRPKIYFMNMYY